MIESMIASVTFAALYAIYTGPIDSCDVSGEPKFIGNFRGPPPCQAVRAPPSPHIAVPYGNGVTGIITASLAHEVPSLSHHGCKLAMVVEPYQM